MPDVGRLAPVGTTGPSGSAAPGSVPSGSAAPGSVPGGLAAQDTQPDGPTAPDAALVEGLAAAAAGAAAATGRRLVVLVDGRSGTGKTTLGDVLAARLGAGVVHLDDVYPGWDGLRAASDTVVSDVLGPPSGYRRWDWERSEPTEWVTIEPDAPLVVEGCGALSRASAPLATLRVWLEADDEVRRDRAIGRDGEVFAREWERWAAQERAFIAAEAPAELADVVVRT